MIRDPPFTAHFLENFIFVLTIFIPIMGGSRAPLRISMLHVPTPVVSGANAVLRCGFDLGGETLYALKWYKDAGEFYRYVPGSDTPFKAFPQSGVDVDMSKSEKSYVYLRNLSLESLGNYTCQVSTDKPFFRCVQTTRRLEVVVPPADGPVLMEEKSDYELGDNVSILCNSGKSKPAPDLKWYINDQLAQSNLFDKETVVYPDQLESSSLALRFRLKPDVLHDGKVILKCVATINHIIAVTTREITASASRQGMCHMNLGWKAIVLTYVFQKIYIKLLQRTN